MEVVTFLPGIAGLVMLLVGLLCFFQPQRVLGPCGISLGNALALSEARAVFGGINIGAASVALYSADAAVYLALGAAWSMAALARFYAWRVDGASIKVLRAPIIFDAALALMFLSGGVAAL